MNETLISAFRFALDITLKATLLFSFTVVVIALLRRSGAAARHIAGTAGLIGALALPLLTLALPSWQVGILPAAPPAPGDEDLPHASAVKSSESFDPMRESRWEAPSVGMKSKARRLLPSSRSPRADGPCPGRWALSQPGPPARSW